MLVVKIGGGEGIGFEPLADEMAMLRNRFSEIILVHGGSHETNLLAERLGHPPQFVTSPSGHTSRRTDQQTLGIFEMVYCGSVNKKLVEMLQSRGVNAVGLSGMDGKIWEGSRKEAIRIVENGKVRVLRDDFTGKAERVNTGLLHNLLDAGYLPVLCPPAISRKGEAINVDGDRAAGLTAAAMKAEQLVILSNVPGLLKNYPDENSLIRSIAKERLGEFEKYAAGRMRKKLLGTREALEGGVGSVILGDARISEPVSRALGGEGTTIR